MKQYLEKYLAEKRLLLDTGQPDENSIWEGVKAGIVPKRKLNSLLWWKVAAIFLFGVLITYVVVDNPRSSFRYKSLSDISPELGKQETELKLIASEKWDQVKPLLVDDNNEYQFLLDELEELEKIHKIYLSDLNSVGANENIIRVLLDYHEKKIQILDRLLLEIQKQKNHEKQI